MTTYSNRDLGIVTGVAFTTAVLLPLWGIVIGATLVVKERRVRSGSASVVVGLAFSAVWTYLLTR